MLCLQALLHLLHALQAVYPHAPQPRDLPGMCLCPPLMQPPSGAGSRRRPVRRAASLAAAAVRLPAPACCSGALAGLPACRPGDPSAQYFARRPL